MPTDKPTATIAQQAREMLAGAKPPPPPPERSGRRQSDQKDGEHTGNDVDYYRVMVEDPKRTAPYMAECEDIIEALNMNFAQGCVFKAIWRDAAMRNLGHKKRGSDQFGLYDAEKVKYYGTRLEAQAKRRIKKANEPMNVSVAVPIAANLDAANIITGFGVPINTKGATPV